MSIATNLLRHLFRGAAIISASLTTAAETTGEPVGEPPRAVFAHYIAGTSATHRFFEREIRLARQYGIDGFALNCGEWLSPRDGRPTRYVYNSDKLYEAARRSGPEFRLFMSPDGSAKAWRERQFVEMFKRYANHPNQFRYRGKPLLSGWGGAPEVYAEFIGPLKRGGTPVTLCPTGVLTPHYPIRKTPSMLARGVFYPGSVADGIFTFNCDGTVEELIAQNSDSGFAAKMAGKIHMAGACPAYNSPNLRDFGGLYGYARQWEGILRDNPELVELVTWNDYGEDSMLMPHIHTFYQHREQLFRRDESALDLTAFYAHAYRSGVRPEIVCDKAYLSYRDRPKAMTGVWDAERKHWGDVRFAGRYPDQIHNDVRDMVNLTVLLTAPAEAEIEQNGQRAVKHLSAGLGTVEAPMRPGATPRVKIVRNGRTVIEFSGPARILEKPDKTDSPVGLHVTNRLWTCGANSAAVQYRPDWREGRMNPLGAPRPGPYNWRIYYSNPGPVAARRTLTFHYSTPDPETGNIQPYELPWTFPPTGGEIRVASRLWTLEPGVDRVEFTAPSGDVRILKIELAPNPIFQSSRTVGNPYPELVEIPGNGTVSPFAIGKFEISNRELEREWPAHASRRNEFSWRDCEPAIQAGWHDAARYCNRLSRRNGLTAVYDETSWNHIPGANGFRLPTEAEWHYTAAGRGENRKYPWGDAHPAPGMSNLRTGHRTAAQGAHPADVSRDGVFDLAGNVAEWCDDRFYPDNLPGTHPVVSPYRSIRGGSWGYYNSDGDNTAREYNHPGYGGYMYLGFRVAIGRDGLEILKKSSAK